MRETKPGAARRRVTMRSVKELPDGRTAHVVGTDCVDADSVDVYVHDARKSWQHVEVDDDPDAPPSQGD